jgi:hypothetical protein
MLTLGFPKDNSHQIWLFRTGSGQVNKWLIFGTGAAHQEKCADSKRKEQYPRQGLFGFFQEGVHGECCRN